MDITKELLTANGWNEGESWWEYTRLYQGNWFFKIEVCDPGDVATVSLDGIKLPHVRTMEQLTQLEWLLSDTYSASLETLPAHMQADARAVDRALEEMGTAR